MQAKEAYSDLSLSQSELREARVWLKDCYPDDVDEINKASEYIIEQHVEHVYDGGIQAFKNSCQMESDR